MIPEIGHIFLIVAFSIAFLQFIMPLIGLKLVAAHAEKIFLRLAESLTLIQCLCISISMVCLAYSFWHDDFSVAYVARNSNSQLAIGYKIAAVWGAHEGSLLLWAWLLSLWSLAVALIKPTLQLETDATILAILGLIAAGFLLFLLSTSNPFIRILPEIPLDGQDLNPLLQDIGLILHPPILYAGYVGLAVPFAFAVAVLLHGQVATPYLKLMRPWVLIAWAFLTIGIALGSWWAYYELGWGGWWFWDPVENASFMPWLVTTALLHCLLIIERRPACYSWGVFLALVGFSLSLLGTFLVRSGVLTSVHSFAADPQRGIFILQYMLTIIGGSLLIYAIRARELATAVNINLISREGSLLVNNLILVTAAGTILLGTLYPLLYDAMLHRKISVGYPYFNAVFIPLMLPLVIVMAVAPFGKWEQDSVRGWLQRTKFIYVVAIVLMLLVLWFAKITVDFFAVAIGLLLSLAIIVGVVLLLGQKIICSGFTAVSLRQWGMGIAHIGFAVTIIGIVWVSAFEVEREVRLQPGEHLFIKGMKVNFVTLKLVEGSNYLSYMGEFTVYKDNKLLANLLPEKRIFVASEMAMSETAISTGLWHDLYVALGEQLDATSWSVRVYYKPLVRWIWLGALFMAIGGVLAAIPGNKKFGG